MPPGQGSYGVFEFAKRCNECASTLQLVTFVTIAINGLMIATIFSTKDKVALGGVAFSPRLDWFAPGNKNSH